jgi:hypothetical protein
MLEITQFTMETPLRVLRLLSFFRRLHTSNVGDNTVFTKGNPLRVLRLHNCLGELQRLNVGDYTVSTMGNPSILPWILHAFFKIVCNHFAPCRIVEHVSM